MSPIPRHISPELVLVDPDLAPVALRGLPEPGWLGRRPSLSEDPHLPGTAQVVGDGRAGARTGWRATLLLTLGAVSLALNGVWLAHLLTPSTSASTSPVSPAAPALPIAPRFSTVEVVEQAPQSSVEARATVKRGGTTVHSRATSKHVPKRGAKRDAVRPASHPHPKGVAKPASHLQWKAVAAATYYNVVIWRDGKRVLDLWPSSPQAAVQSVTPHHGSHSRLSPGRYLWFVYPGFGAKREQRYGALAGSGVLVVLPQGGA